MEYLQNHRYLMLFEGIIFVLLGILAIALPGISTLSIELFIGWLLLFGGIIQLYRTFSSRHAPGFVGSLLTSILYTTFGVLLVLFPIAGVLSLTILLTCFFIAEGIAKIYLAFQWRTFAKWGWLLFNGIIALILAFFIWSGWPSTAFSVLGILIGINMLFFGVTLIAVSLNLPRIEEKK